MSVRKVFLKLHLYLGLVSGIFLIVLGLTGSILAFESHLDHWLNPRLWYVSATGTALPEEQLVRNIEQQKAPSRVFMVQMPRHGNLAQVMVLRTPGSGGGGRVDPRTLPQVFVNPYDGAILGERIGGAPSQKFMAFVEKIHVSLFLGKVGDGIISIVTAVLFLEVLFGIYLWFYTRRASIKWDAFWLRVSFDAHNAIGLYAGIFIFISAFSGVVMGFDFAKPLIFKLTNSAPAVQRRPPDSTVVPGATPISIDRAIDIAHQAIPDSTPVTLQLPQSPKASFNISMRVPGETSTGVYSGANIDQYSGQVLQQRDFRTDSSGFRVLRVIRSLHTGDIYGLTSRIIMSLSSLLLVIMVITGFVIWWKKLAI